MEKGKSQIQKLEQEFEAIKKEIASTSLIKKGSITRTYQSCRNPNCRCNKDSGSRHGPYYLLTTKEKARTRTFSVPQDMLSEVESYMDNYKLLISKVKMLEVVSEKIIKLKISDYRLRHKKGK